MSDTVINRGNATSIVRSADIDGLAYIIVLARELRNADTNRDGKVSKEELMSFIDEKLIEKDRETTQNECKSGAHDKIYKNLLFDIIQAANVAVANRLITEVTVPDVPNLCARINLERT